MLDAVKRYATKILLLHVLLLALVVTIVVFAARQVYTSARQQAIQQNGRRLDLLADQTARGIENHYLSIMSDLELILRDESDPAATQPHPLELVGGRFNLRRFTEMKTVLVTPNTVGLMWRQLHGRVSQLFLVDNESGRVTLSFPEGTNPQANGITTDNIEWFRSLKGPSMSRFRRSGATGAGYHLIAVPALGLATPAQSAAVRPPAGRDAADPAATRPVAARDNAPREVPASARTVVAMVPIDSVKERFFDPLNDKGVVNAALIDDTGAVLISMDSRLAGGNLMKLLDVQVQGQVMPFVAGSSQGSLVIDHPFRMGNTTTPPRIFAFEPMTELPGRRWTVLTTSPLADSDSLVNSVFKGALAWAIFLTLSVTAVLVSTSFFMIHARVRLERTRHEMLRRELEQARQIQLAWLPDKKSVPAGLEVSAVNLPASHISGDFYNWFALPGAERDGLPESSSKVAIVVGDVTGHGMAAAFLMATTQLLVRTTLSHYEDPGRCLREVNRQLCTMGFRGQFVTIVVLVLDPASNSVEMALAGHPAPLVERDGKFEALPMDPQLVLGVDPQEQYKTEGFLLEPGCSVLLYTDGVVEAISPAGRQYGVAKLMAAVTAPGEPPPHPERRIQMVLEDMKGFCGNQELLDDVTLVAIRTAAAPSLVTQQKP